MLYQIGIILIIIVAAIIVSKRFNQKNDLIYEDEMEEDELKKLDDEIGEFLSNSDSREL